jgi:hypothetical protein
MTEDLEQELLSPYDVARLWNVHPATVISWAERGYIRGFVMNPGSKKPLWRIYADSVRERMGLDKPAMISTA